MSDDHCCDDHDPSHLHLKPGTVMMKVPETGASQDACLICTGPIGRSPGEEREMAKEAFLVGMMAGVVALREPRPLLCIDHETQFREMLASRGVSDEETLKKLGIEYKVADGTEEMRKP